SRSAMMSITSPAGASTTMLERVLSAMAGTLQRTTLEAVLDGVHPALPASPVGALPAARTGPLLTTNEVVDDRATPHLLQPDLEPTGDLPTGPPARPLRPAVLDELSLQPGPQGVEHPGLLEGRPHRARLRPDEGLVDDVDETAGPAAPGGLVSLGRVRTGSGTVWPPSPTRPAARR